MSYINPSPGVAGKQVTLTLFVDGTAGDTGMSLPALQDVTVNNSNDVFTWTQLDSGSKKNVATTATNSLAMNIVLDETTFFGNTAASANTAAKLGVFNLSKNKTYCDFSLFIGDGVTISGTGICDRFGTYSECRLTCVGHTNHYHCGRRLHCDQFLNRTTQQNRGSQGPFFVSP
jgi:hypothetical protein